MQRRYRLLLQALLLAACLVIGMSAALFAADEGLVIVAVDDQGPADQAGVVRGDILLAINDTPTNSVADLLTALAAIEAGATVTLQVQHGDEVMMYEVETGQQGQRAYLGLRPYGADVVMPRPPDVLRWHGEQGVLPDRRPLAAGRMPQIVVMEVLTESAAAEAGVQVQDVITAMNGEVVNDPRMVKEQLAALEPGATITLTVLRGADETLDLAATLGEDQDGGAMLGVKLAVVATFEEQRAGEAIPHFMPTPPDADAPFPWQREERHGDRDEQGGRFFFWREGPGHHHPRFFRFHHFAPPFLHFFNAPAWMMGEETMPWVEEFTLAYPAEPAPMWLTPPVVGEAQIEIQQLPSVLEEAELYY